MRRELAFLPQLMKTPNICPPQIRNKGDSEMAVCKGGRSQVAHWASVENKPTAQAYPRTQAAQHQPGRTLAAGASTWLFIRVIQFGLGRRKKINGLSWHWKNKTHWDKNNRIIKRKYLSRSTEMFLMSCFRPSLLSGFKHEETMTDDLTESKCQPEGRGLLS